MPKETRILMATKSKSLVYLEVAHNYMYMTILVVEQTAAPSPADARSSIGDEGVTCVTNFGIQPTPATYVK
jgi:hypothetical protein